MINLCDKLGFIEEKLVEVRTAQAAWAPLLKKWTKQSRGAVVIDVNFRQFASELSVLNVQYPPYAQARRLIQYIQNYENLSCRELF